MASESGKVTRRLTVKLEPMRSEESAVEAFSMVLKGFTESLEDEDEGELFADQKGPKPKLDK